MSPLDKSERVPILCYVTDRRSLGGAEALGFGTVLMSKIAATVAAGVDWIQIREKDLSGKGLAQLTQDALGCVERGSISHTGGLARTRILVNDRLDVALATQACGIHLGENSLPTQEVRRLAHSPGREKEFLIGVSCHSLEAARRAEQSRADYLFFGPVFTTPSKAVYGAPQGLERLAEVCQAVSIPVLAIGGVTVENCASCLSAGASGIAAIRLFQDAPGISTIVQSIRVLSRH